jgi:hypothetical protein
MIKSKLFGLIGSLIIIIFTNPANAVTLAQENFPDSSSLTTGDWYVDGRRSSEAAFAFNAFDPVTGALRVERNTTGRTVVLASVSLNTLGFENLILSYDWFEDGATVDEFIQVDIRDGSFINSQRLAIHIPQSTLPDFEVQNESISLPIWAEDNPSIFIDFTVHSDDNSDYVYLDNIVLSAVPVPAAAWLFGSGLLGLIGVARRKKL